MRIKSIEIEGFRAFVNRHFIDLDADVILIGGANGMGKTSLLDAILWALTGVVPRLSKDQQHIVSLYAPFGFAEVKLEFVDPNEEIRSVVRRYDGESEKLIIHMTNDSIESQKAESLLIERLWRSGFIGNKGQEEFAEMLTRCIYLEQDLIRRFVESESEVDRFQVLSELIGAAQLIDLQKLLESERTAWRKASNNKSQELHDAEAKLVTLEQAIQRIGSQDESFSNLQKRWNDWWKLTIELVEDTLIPQLSAANAIQELDQGLRNVFATQGTLDRHIGKLLNLLEEVSKGEQYGMPPDEDVQNAQFKTEKLKTRLAEISDQIAISQHRATTERKKIVQLRDTQEELKALAKLALRHLGEHCPICAQTYNQEATQLRLQEIVDQPEPTLEKNHDEDVIRFSELMEQTEKELSEAANNLRELHKLQEEKQTWEAEILIKLDEFSIKSGISEAHLFIRDEISKTQKLNKNLKEIYKDGEKLNVDVIRLAEQKRRHELEKDLQPSRELTKKLRITEGNYQRTDQVATEIIDALRGATDEAVGLKVKELQPLFERIFARIDPHPTFTKVQFLSSISHRKGRLSTTVEDPQHKGLSNIDPLPIFSSSQLNALAVSVFLSVNLGTSSLPLDVALLDDPLQSLDDINLLGLIDVLRRTRDSRQIFISTHDSRILSLLERKLRPVKDYHRTHVINFDIWNREGPKILEKDVATSTMNLRIVSK